MTTRQQVAEAFAAGKSAKCHNAKTDGRNYWLHGNLIATRGDAGNAISFDWCGWFTPTTAAHMNEIFTALGMRRYVSYAMARDGKTASKFLVLPDNTSVAA